MNNLIFNYQKTKCKYLTCLYDWLLCDKYINKFENCFISIPDSIILFKCKIKRI